MAAFQHAQLLGDTQRALALLYAGLLTTELVTTTASCPRDCTSTSAEAACVRLLLVSLLPGTNCDCCNHLQLAPVGCVPHTDVGWACTQTVHSPAAVSVENLVNSAGGLGECAHTNAGSQDAALRLNYCTCHYATPAGFRLLLMFSWSLIM